MKSLIYSLAVALLLTISYSQAQEQEYYWVEQDGYLELNKSTDPISYIRFSEDGKILFTGDTKNHYSRWEVETGNQIFQLQLSETKYQIKEYVIDRIGENTYFIFNGEHNVCRYNYSNDTITYLPFDRPSFGGGGGRYEFSKVELSDDEEYLFAILSVFPGHIRIPSYKDYYNYPLSNINAFTHLQIYAISRNSRYNIFKNQVNNSIDSSQFLIPDGFKFLKFSGDEKYLMHIDTFNVFRMYDLEKNGAKYQKNAMNSKVWNFLQIDFMPDSDYFFILRHYGNQKSSQLEFYTTKGFNHIKTVTFELAFPANRIENYGDLTVITSSNGKIRLYKTADLLLTDELDFVATDIRNYRNTDIKFKPISKIEYENYQWYFGDGTISTQKEPTHRYAVPGKYTVTLNAWNDIDDIIELEKQEYIHVVNELKADFEASTNLGYIPLTVSFKNMSQGDDLTYKWSFNSNVHSPEYEYKTVDDHYVSLIVNDGLHFDTASTSIKVRNPKPVILNHTVLNEEPHWLLYKPYINKKTIKTGMINLHKKANNTGYILRGYLSYKRNDDTEPNAEFRIYDVCMTLNLDNEGVEINRIENLNQYFWSDGSSINGNLNNHIYYYSPNSRSTPLSTSGTNLENLTYFNIRETIDINAQPDYETLIVTEELLPTGTSVIVSKYYWETEPKLLHQNKFLINQNSWKMASIVKIFKTEIGYDLFVNYPNHTPMDIFSLDSNLNLIKKTSLEINKNSVVNVEQIKFNHYALLIQNKNYHDYSLIILHKNISIMKILNVTLKLNRAINMIREYDDNYLLGGGKLGDNVAFFYISKIDGSIYEYEIPNRPGSLGNIIYEGNKIFSAALNSENHTFIRIRLDNDLTSVPLKPRIEPDIVLYPNPTDENINIQSDIRIIKAELLDPLGRTVKSDIPITHAVNSDNPDDGFYEINFALKAVAPGMYFLKLTTIYGDVTIKKVVVMY